MIFISIITPVYNRAHMIRTCIDSVCAQDYKYWEHIIVDDGSTDSIAEVIDEYKEDERIKYVTKKNSGAADSRNFGAKLAKGEWIIFLDSDDAVKLNWLDKFVKNANNKFGIISCSFEKRKSERIEKIQNPINLRFLSDKDKFCFVAGAYMVRNEIFSKVNGFDISLSSGHHTDLGIRLAMKIYELGFYVNWLNEVLLTVYVHDNQRIRDNFQLVYDGTKALISKHKEILLRDNSRKELSDYLGVCAFAAYKLGLKKESIYLQIEKIRNNNLNIKSTLSLIRYLIA
ncbi:MAG: glycosyltransferase family A protein [Cyclobacteriaceae bacterium]|jgi:glycosyltransferase involved in cell wall biosynthesis|nr:glycosyltransferase family A protein [Cyclobacteriaceae bacterium]